MTIDGSAGDPGYLLVIDDDQAILSYRDHSPAKCDIEGLPLARLARLFGV